MVTRLEDGLLLVVNAARKEADLAHLRAQLAARRDDRAAVRSRAAGAAGPGRRCGAGAACAEALRRLPFMSAADSDGRRHRTASVTRSGYTGEDGFEISLPAGDAPRILREALARASPRSRRSGSAPATRCASKPASASTATTSTRPRRRSRPVSPGPSASAAAPRAAFPAQPHPARSSPKGPPRRRVGIRPDGRAPAREGTAILDAAGDAVGTVTSGGFGPTVGAPDRDGLCRCRHAAQGTRSRSVVRGVPRPAHVAPLPFVPHRYYRRRVKSGGCR